MNIQDRCRIATDSFGSVTIPEGVYWGAQTGRALHYFTIGSEKMPQSMIKALALVKKAAAIVNCEMQCLDSEIANLIVQAADEIIAGKLDSHFPISVWQTGSGTQSNMNVNEVIANRAMEIAESQRNKKLFVHTNDHVNMGQSSNDTFPTAMRIAVAQEIHEQLLPALESLICAFQYKIDEFQDIIKIGRTHLQDATPLTLGQEFSGYLTQLQLGKDRVARALQGLLFLAQGGTAVGTGLNAQAGFDVKIADKISALTGYNFSTAPNKFEALASNDTEVEMSGALNTLSCSLMKIANDIRLLSSGPRCGFGEITLPENEPGSSIMPGKINPTQCEAITMVCARVMGNHVTISIAASNGHLELNVFKPVIIYSLLQSIQLLGDSMKSFAQHCVIGIKANKSRIAFLLHQSLMLVTALNKEIGYDNSAKIALYAHQHDVTLREAALATGLVNMERFDFLTDPAKMLKPA